MRPTSAMIASTFAVLLAIEALPARADDASDRLALATRLVDTMHYTANVHRMLPVLTAQIKAVMKKAGQDPGGDLDEMDRVAAAHEDEISADYRRKIAKVYAAEFSKKDLAAQIAFYESPVGRRLLDKQLVIAKAGVQIGAEMGQQLAAFAERDAEKRRGSKTPPK